MKTRIIQPTEQKPETPIKYPCLMEHHDGSIAYATSAYGGVLLRKYTSMIGDHAYPDDLGSPWVSLGYTPMRGKVVIEFDMGDGQ